MVKDMMDNCRHTQWLRLWRLYDQVEFEASDRPVRLLDKLVNPNTSIALVAFIGNRAKSLALSTFNIRDIKNRTRLSHGEIHLEVKPLHGQEILIASGDLPLHINLPRSSYLHRCHETTTKPSNKT